VNNLDGKERRARLLGSGRAFAVGSGDRLRLQAVQEVNQEDACSSCHGGSDSDSVWQNRASAPGGSGERE
jgi:hypothetical protein